MEAFKLLYDRYNKKLYYFSLRYLGDNEETEELVQSVFISIWNTGNHLMKPCLLKIIFTGQQ